jgi:DNA repair exonuclease SbcCD nuclease subunit
MKAIFFSDIHFNRWYQFNVDNSRLKMQGEVLKHLFSLASAQKVPLIFGGDMFNNPKEIQNALWGYTMVLFKHLYSEYPDVHVYAISGNHDMAEKNTLEHRSPSYVKTLAEVFPQFHCIDFKTQKFDGFSIYGIPYLEQDLGFNDLLKTKQVKGKTILLVHTSLAGQKDTSGMVVGDGTNIDTKLFAKFHKVMSGHIHKPGLVKKGFISIGAPMQLRLSDKGGRFGYWVLRDNLDVDFKEITFTPKFRLYKKASEITNSKDYWVKEVDADNPGVDPFGGKEKVLSQEAWLKMFFKASGIKSRNKKAFVYGIMDSITQEDD